MSETRGSNRILGCLSSDDDAGLVRMEDRFDTSIEDLWSALTEPERLARWLGKVEGDLRLGGEFNLFYFASEWEGIGRVEECVPPERLVVRTREHDASRDASSEPGPTKDEFGEGGMEIMLTADGDQTVFVLKERVPLQQIAEYGAGIQVHVDDLGSYLAGGERCDAQTRWNELFASYRQLAAEMG